MELHEIVKRYRKQKGLTQAALAEKVGTSERTISRLETGASASRSLLVTVARALEIPEDDLHRRESSETAGQAVDAGTPAGGYLDSSGGNLALVIGGKRAELDDEEYEPPGRPRYHTFSDGLEVARFVTSFEPRIRVEAPADTADRHAALRFFVKCAEDLRDSWRNLSDVELFDAEQTLHKALVDVVGRPIASDPPGSSWYVSGTTIATKKTGPNGVTYDVVEAVLSLATMPF